MGALKPFIFAFCDVGYYEKYGRALKNSALAQGHECEVTCSGRTVDGEQSKIWHSHQRYHLLPDLLDKHDAILMLDADCVIRAPALVPPGYEIGIVKQDMADYQRCVNGGCVYITREMKPLAMKLQERMVGDHWFADQISLFRLCVKRGNYKTWIINGDFFSWRANPSAPIWTGKGKAKFRDDFVKEVGKWNA